MGVDIDWPYGGDIALTPSGDWNLLIDTYESAPASEQKIVRLSLTAPAVRDDNGNVISRADDTFAQDWGVGITRYLGEEITTQDKNSISNSYTQALSEDPDFQSVPAPVITVTSLDAETLKVSVSAVTTAGATATVTASSGG